MGKTCPPQDLVDMLFARVKNTRSYLHGRDPEFISISYSTLCNYGMKPTLEKMYDVAYIKSLMSLRSKVGLDILVSDCADMKEDTWTDKEIIGSGRHKNHAAYLIDNRSNAVSISGNENTEIRKFYIDSDKVIIIGEVNTYASVYDNKTVFRKYNVHDEENKFGPLVLDVIYSKEKELGPLKKILNVDFEGI